MTEFSSMTVERKHRPVIHHVGQDRREEEAGALEGQRRRDPQPEDRDDREGRVDDREDRGAGEHRDEGLHRPPHSPEDEPAEEILLEEGRRDDDEQRQPLQAPPAERLRELR